MCKLRLYFLFQDDLYHKKNDIIMIIIYLALVKGLILSFLQYLIMSKT